MSSLVALLLFTTNQADAGILLQFKPPLNRAYRYAIETTLGAGTGAPIKVEKTVTATGLDKGVYTVVTKFNSVSLGATTEGIPQAERFLKQQVVTQTVDGAGRILSSDAIRATAALMIGGLEALNAVTFPPNPVKVGDSWQGKSELGGARQVVGLKLVSVREEHGRRLARLEMSLIEPPPSLQMAMAIPLEVDAETGVLRRLELKSSLSDAGGKKTTVHVLIEGR